VVYVAKAGKITIGDPVTEHAQLVTSKATPPESFYGTTEPRAGLAGIEEALRKGLIREATKADSDAWFQAEAAGSPERDVPPNAESDKPKPKRMRIRIYKAYVVLKRFTYPSGLYGSNSVTFFIPTGVQTPTGTAGHSSVYDCNKLNCQGSLSKP
jgi:hypothetical protein